MSGRFTLAGLLMWVTLIALVLAIVVPIERYSRRVKTYADSVVSVGASADGSMFGALMGDGRVLFWDKQGLSRGSLPTQESFGAELAMSFDGKLVSVSPNEILEVGTRSVWRSLPTSVTAIVFSPTEARLAALNDTHADPFVVRDERPTGRQRRGPPRYDVYTMDRDSPPQLIAHGQLAAFSPDGNRLAVGAESEGRINIYDVASGQLERGRPAMISDSLAWAPDGHSLAAVSSSQAWDTTPRVSLETHDLAGALRSALVPCEKPVRGEFHALIYLPDGKHLLVGAATLGFKAFHVSTLQPVPAADMSKVWYVAAGLNGDTFIAAESHAVDLWDVATLCPRQRLFEAAPPPDHRLPICGLVIWVIAFAVRRQKAARSLRAAEEALWHPARSGALV